MNQMDVKLNDLPDLPFEKILGYLSLEDRIKCRAVSRKWRDTIDSFRPKDLCFSGRSMGFINEKARLVSGAFAWNFISSTRFELFFKTFGKSILDNLKHLRICDLRLDAENVSTAFVQALNLFGRLEELDIIRFGDLSDKSCRISLELNLPMLNSLQFEQVLAVKKLTLDSPKLQNVKIFRGLSNLRVDLIRGESVEKLVIDYLGEIEVKKMKNLKYLISNNSRIDSTLLSGLKQLKEIHLYSSNAALKLFDQKQRYGRVDLKIFLWGLLLDGPNDPTIGSLSRDFTKATLASLAANPSRVAQEIPLIEELDYPAIERGVPRESEMDLLKRFTDLIRIDVVEPVQDIERFLQILKNMDNIVDLQFWFVSGDLLQDLFDRLPEHCATLQKLTIFTFNNISPLSDFSFLPKLKNLTDLCVNCSMNIESVRKILEGLQFLSQFSFKYLNKGVTIYVKHHLSAKWFKIALGSERVSTKVGGEERTEVPDLDSAILFIVETLKE